MFTYYRDYEVLLNNQIIKASKVRGFFDDFKEKIDDLIFGFGYLQKRENAGTLWKFDWKLVRKEEQEKPRVLRIF